MADWQVGDLALCISQGHPKFDDKAVSLTIGRCYTVRKVGRPIDWLDYERALGLAEVIPAYGPNYGWPESMFIKITPPEADAFDREVIEQMSGEPVEVHP
jgi:hypothetical protein